MNEVPEMPVLSDFLVTDNGDILVVKKVEVPVLNYFKSCSRSLAGPVDIEVSVPLFVNGFLMIEGEPMFFVSYESVN